MHSPSSVAKPRLIGVMQERKRAKLDKPWRERERERASTYAPKGAILGRRRSSKFVEEEKNESPFLIFKTMQEKTIELAQSCSSIGIVVVSSRSSSFTLTNIGFGCFFDRCF